MENINVEKLVDNLYICYIPSEEKRKLEVKEYRIGPDDKFESLEKLYENEPEKIRSLEVPESYDVCLLNRSPYDIEWVQYSLFRMFDPDNPGEKAMLWQGKAEKLPANSATTPTVKFDDDFGYHDVFGWTLSVNGIRDKLTVSFSDLRATGMFREEDCKNIPAIDKKGYMYKVEMMEMPQRNLVFKAGWEKMESIEAADGVEYFRYPCLRP